MYSIEVVDEKSMLELGHLWAANFTEGCVVFLSGDLGVGKTTLVKGLLSGYGFDGIVTSPTYTLVESYVIKNRQFYHFDLYRLKRAQELEMIGVRDMITTTATCLVEWPDRGFGVLPEPDFEIKLEYMDTGRKVSVAAGKKQTLNEFCTL